MNRRLTNDYLFFLRILTETNQMKCAIYLILSLITYHGFAQSRGEIKITSEKTVKINKQELSKNTSGVYVYSKEIANPTILTLESQNKEWEIYWEPASKVNISISNGSLSFKGDLVTENKYLLSEKQLNDDISSYLSKNWYSLHKLGQDDFIQKMDSIKSLYLTKMAGASELNSTFQEVNTASVHFAFDRMLLRYPRFHKNFTGNPITLTNDVIQSSLKNLDELRYFGLSTYKKFTRTWLDREIEKSFQDNKDTTVYRGLLRTETALDIISRAFTNTELKENWSFEYIKSHIEQYTWLNGKELLETLEKTSKSPDIIQSIQAYKNGILEKRKDLETVVYKTVKGFQLEVYIFKPDNFDASKKYAALAAFHGGGWIVGDAAFTISSAKHAAENGLIGFSVEYRLSNYDDITPEEATQDARDFIKWLRKNADSLSINPEKIIAKGLSAGGHLVSSISVLQEEKESIPNAIILVSPALDTSDDYFKSLLRNNQNSNDLSPLENLKAGLKMPKTLILQGKTDNLTPTKYAEAFHENMNELGYVCELVIYEGCGHLFTPSHLDDTGWPQPDPTITKKAYKKQAEFYQELNYTQNN